MQTSLVERRYELSSWFFDLHTKHPRTMNRQDKMQNLNYTHHDQALKEIKISGGDAKVDSVHLRGPHRLLSHVPASGC